MEVMVTYKLTNKTAARFIRKLNLFSIDYRFISRDDKTVTIYVLYEGRNVKKVFEEYLNDLANS